MLKGNRFLQTCDRLPAASESRLPSASSTAELFYISSIGREKKKRPKSRSTCLIATTTRRSQIQWSDFWAVAAVAALWRITACPASAPVHAGKRFSLLPLQNSGWFDAWCFALVFCWWKSLLSRSFRSLTELFFFMFCGSFFRRPRATRRPGNRLTSRSEEATCRLEAVIWKLMTLFFFLRAGVSYTAPKRSRPILGRNFWRLCQKARLGPVHGRFQLISRLDSSETDHWFDYYSYLACATLCKDHFLMFVWSTQ